MFQLHHFCFQNQLLVEGQTYAVMLYTWRCCSRALPQVSLTLFSSSLLHNQNIHVVLCQGYLKRTSYPVFLEQSWPFRHNMLVEHQGMQHIFDILSCQNAKNLPSDLEYVSNLGKKKKLLSGWERRKSRKRRRGEKSMKVVRNVQKNGNTV